MIRVFFYLLLLTGLTVSCNQNNPSVKTEKTDTAVAEKTKPQPITPTAPSITYHFIKKKEWQLMKDSFEGLSHIDILTSLNRVDSLRLFRMDSIIVPDNYSLPIHAYQPFPETIEYLNGVRKIILFSYPAQSFAAYENGKIILCGPTNMGRKSKKTPKGLYFANWKAKETISTVDDSWKLKWNFNVHNKLGVGFHQYALPGYPASHSCMRLKEADAKFLYGWAEQWILKNNQLVAQGTPVIVFGDYPFGKTKPWYKLVDSPNALAIPADTLKTYIEPHLEKILEKQKQRDEVVANTATAQAG